MAYTNNLQNNKGMVTMIAIIVLLVLTVIGLMTIQTTNIELQTTRNQRISTLSFYLAEAGRGFVAADSSYYNSSNLDCKEFPNDGTEDCNPTARTTGDTLGFSNADISINGTVRFVTSMATRVIPRGSGFSYGNVRAHWYLMQCSGFEAGNATTDKPNVQVEQGFFRVGL